MTTRATTSILCFVASCLCISCVTTVPTEPPIRDPDGPTAMVTAPVPLRSPAMQKLASPTDALVNQLGAHRFHDRRAAQQKLIAIGEPVLPTIKAATQHADPEVSERAKGMLGVITLMSLPEYNGPGVFHVARKTESLAAIARLHGVDPRFLCKVNRLADHRATVRRGRRIIIPCEK